MIIEIVLGLLVVIEGYVIWNLFRKTEFLETWVEDFTQVIQQVDTDLKEIEHRYYHETGRPLNSDLEEIT